MIYWLLRSHLTSPATHSVFTVKVSSFTHFWMLSWAQTSLLNYRALYLTAKQHFHWKSTRLNISLLCVVQTSIFLVKVNSTKQYQAGNLCSNYSYWLKHRRCKIVSTSFTCGVTVDYIMWGNHQLQNSYIWIRNSFWCFAWFLEIKKIFKDSSSSQIRRNVLSRIRAGISTHAGERQAVWVQTPRAALCEEVNLMLPHSGDTRTQGTSENRVKWPWFRGFLALPDIQRKQIQIIFEKNCPQVKPLGFSLI